MLRTMVVMVTMAISSLASAALTRLPDVGAIEDTFVSMHEPDNDWGAVREVWLGPADHRQAYLKFDLSGITVPENHRVTFAVLRMVWAGIPQGGYIVVHEATTDEWDEHMLWANRVGYKPTQLAAVVPEFLIYPEVTDAVNAALAGDKILSLVVFCSGNYFNVYSSSDHENPEYRPALEIFTRENPIDVQGVVVPVGYTGDKSRICVRVGLFQNGVLVKGDEVNLDSDGRFTIDDMEAGEYTLVVQGDCWLTASRTVTLGGAHPHIVDNIVLMPGDSNGDDAVTFEDFSLLQNSYGQSGWTVNPMSAVATGGCGGLGLLLMAGLAWMLWGLSVRWQR